MAPILVVDDCADAREAVRALLELDGYPVTEAADGREALEMLVGDRRNEPCLIVLDLEMPLMSGWELLNVLRSYHRLAAIPVLVVSAHERGSVPQTASLAGYFQKPYAARQLLRKVRECAPELAHSRQAETASNGPAAHRAILVPFTWEVRNAECVRPISGSVAFASQSRRGGPLPLLHCHRNSRRRRS